VLGCCTCQRTACHASYITPHTLHVTRHTPHVTRHTSHVTRHTLPSAHIGLPFQPPPLLRCLRRRRRRRCLCLLFFSQRIVSEWVFEHRRTCTRCYSFSLKEGASSRQVLWMTMSVRGTCRSRGSQYTKPVSITHTCKALWPRTSLAPQEMSSACASVSSPPTTLPNTCSRTAIVTLFHCASADSSSPCACHPGWF
jgi:hypothetical protein